MIKLHADAKPVFKKGTTEQIGWILETPNFSFEAYPDKDDTINVYIEWGDGMGGDMSNHANWEEAQAHLDSFLGAS